MQIIKTVTDQIEDEVCGARDYAKLAAEFKQTRPELARLWFELSEVELSHVDKLHAQAIKLIEEARSKGVTVPTGMEEIWNDKHSKAIGIAAEAKSFQALYR